MYRAGTSSAQPSQGSMFECAAPSMSTGQKFVTRGAFCYVVSETLSVPSAEGATHSMAQENRRQWERFAHPAELQLTAGGHVLPVRLIDVSRQGMQVVAPVLLHVGDEVGTSLPATLPTATSRATGAVRGRVCWTAPARAD